MGITIPSENNIEIEFIKTPTNNQRMELLKSVQNKNQ